MRFMITVIVKYEDFRQDTPLLENKLHFNSLHSLILESSYITIYLLCSIPLP